MASSIIIDNAVQGETFLPGQILVFGGFALRANSLGQLEQIESYAPGRQVRFGSLNFTADIRGDLILDGFKPQPSVPYCHDGHDLALQPDSALEAALQTAPIFNPELAPQIEDGCLDTASGAATSTAIEPNTDFVPHKARDSKVPDSEPPAPALIESDWAPIMEFTAADVFQHSPFGDILSLLKCLSLSGEAWPDYGWDADDEEIQSPPTTHLVATVDDLTDMLDYESEDIDAGDDQEPAPTGH